MSLRWVETFLPLQFQRLAKNSQWNGIKTTPLLISGLDISGSQNTLSYNLVNNSQPGFYLKKKKIIQVPVLIKKKKKWCVNLKGKKVSDKPESAWST